MTTKQNPVVIARPTKKRKYQRNPDLTYGRPRLHVPRVRVQVQEVDLERGTRRVKGGSRSLTVYFCTPDQAMKIITAAFKREATK